MILRGGRELPLYPRLVAAEAPLTIVLPGRVEGLTEALRLGDLHWGRLLASRRYIRQPWPAIPTRRPMSCFHRALLAIPKALPWTHVNPIKCGADAHYHQRCPPRMMWSLGRPIWAGMMGPWLIYAAFLNPGDHGALLWQAPTERDFGEFVQAAGITMLGVIPSMVRTWRSTGCMEGIDFSAIPGLSVLLGSAPIAEDMHYLMALASYRPILEYCGGTELAGGYLLSTLVEPVAPATFNSATLGTDLAILDEDGQECASGEVFLVPPAIGMSTRVLNRDHREVYYEDVPKRGGVPLRRHGDQVERLAPGIYRVHGRADDVMNLGGIMVSSAEIERALNTMPGVVETAAIAVPPPGGGPSLLVIFAVLEDAGDHLQACPEQSRRKAMQQTIRRELNPLFKIHVDSSSRIAAANRVEQGDAAGFAGAV